ncbi:hypothetical protein M3Y95_00470000 [Aphelenchoides besseyi]|nr:hypothetical protein M3Y95_00470000 [Aphelenchoides besseyi]
MSLSQHVDLKAFDNFNAPGGYREEQLIYNVHWILNLTERTEVQRGVSETLHFTTAFGTAAYDWIAHVQHRRRAGRLAMPGNDGVEMYVEPGRSPLIHIKPLYCRFGYEVYADAQLSTLLRMKHMITCSVSVTDSQRSEPAQPTPSIFGLSECYKSPTGEFRTKLARFLTDRLRPHWRYVISIQMAFRRTDFENASESFSATLRVPLNNELNFLYSYKNNPDFLVVCHDGEVGALRSSLFLSSDYWRSFFEKNKGKDFKEHMLTQFSVVTMTAINEFLHTNAISPPNGPWSYREADELMKAVEFIKPVRKDEVRQYVHHMLIRAVKQVASNDLTEVVKILLVANKNSFSHVKIMSYAAICNYHYYTFKDRFNADAANDEDRAIFEQLQLSRAFTFQNPIEYIDRMWLKISKCQLCISN